ncbi:MAG: hypothetical protein Q4B42_05900 [Oscillospiraceae bacterium]|nr:hypothetical protein [Oscillospiraceae bacterium]
MLKLSLRGFKVGISFWLCVFAAVSLALAETGAFVSFIIAALAHEAAHGITAAACKAPVRELTLALGKFELDCGLEALSDREKIAVFLSGPLVNIFLAALSLALGFARAFYANALLAAINLLPSAHLDGGRIMLILLSKELSCKTAARAVKLSSFVCGVAVSALGAFLIINEQSNATALLFGIYMILGALRVDWE